LAIPRNRPQNFKIVNQGFFKDSNQNHLFEFSSHDDFPEVNMEHHFAFINLIMIYAKLKVFCKNEYQLSIQKATFFTIPEKNNNL